MIVRPSKATALAVARAMLDKKALDVQVLHVAPLTSIADYLVIGSGRIRPTNTGAIADSVAEVLSGVGQRPLSLEGTTSGQWVLIDFGDVVAHMFKHDTRSHYALERLWSDARSIPIPDNPLTFGCHAEETHDSEADFTEDGLGHVQTADHYFYHQRRRVYLQLFPRVEPGNGRRPYRAWRRV